MNPTAAPAMSKAATIPPLQGHDSSIKVWVPQPAPSSLLNLSASPNHSPVVYRAQVTFVN